VSAKEKSSFGTSWLTESMNWGKNKTKTDCRGGCPDTKIHPNVDRTRRYCAAKIKIKRYIPNNASRHEKASRVRTTPHIHTSRRNTCGPSLTWSERQTPSFHERDTKRASRAKNRRTSLTAAGETCAQATCWRDPSRRIVQAGSCPGHPGCRP
jgi:hypothetical protein